MLLILEFITRALAFPYLYFSCLIKNKKNDLLRLRLTQKMAFFRPYTNGKTAKNNIKPTKTNT